MFSALILFSHEIHAPFSPILCRERKEGEDCFERRLTNPELKNERIYENGAFYAGWDPFFMEGGRVQFGIGAGGAFLRRLARLKKPRLT